MAKEGWIAVRNIPLPRTSTMKNGQALHKILKVYFRTHRLCPQCKGYGFTLERTPEIAPVETIKYEGIRALETMKGYEDISFSDVLREVLMTEIAGRQPCERCCGARFVKKDAA